MIAIRSNQAIRGNRAIIIAATLALLIGPAGAGAGAPSLSIAAAHAGGSPIVTRVAATSVAARLPQARPSSEVAKPAEVAGPETSENVEAPASEAPAEAEPPAPAEMAGEVSPAPIPAPAAEGAEAASPPESESPAEASVSETPSDSDAAAVPLPHPRPTEPDAASAESTSPASEGESQSVESGASTGAPLPRPRPDLSAAEAARLLATQFYGFQPDFRLRSALDALTDGRYADARRTAASHPNPLVPGLVDWLIARQPSSAMSAGDIIAVLATHLDWPEPEQLQLRAEQAFHATGAQGEAVLTFYGQAEPLTVGGRLTFAAALRSAGRYNEALAIVQDLWREWLLAPNQAGAVVTRFGTMLTREDHLYRFRRLVLRGRTADAVAQAQLLGTGYDDLARAVIAVLDQRKDARTLLRNVAPRFLADPLYVFARVQQLLRARQPIEAARFLIGAQSDLELSGDGDIWWEERRDLSRALLDQGTPDLAYRVVADARPVGEGKRVEAAFHAGWYALRYLADPVRAEPHFRELHNLATLPRTKARASYWLGRTHEAQNHADAAGLDYVEAARFGGAFYGQLAREKLGITTTGLERMPRPSALDRMRFADREMVKAVRLLASAGRADLAGPFLIGLGESVGTPGEVMLLSTLARRIARPQAGIRAAALAEERGLAVACLPALFFGVPAELRPPDPVDRALVYAIVRQESAFDHTAVSHAGARGLMQLMPATARATARNVRIPYSEQRLLTDPLYNATLGAHHLGELLGGLNRSYVLTFAGYNAGPGRALQWVRAYGDPRGGTVDPVDWIERIPFDETRDYVQKVMENLQLYRSKTGHPLSLWQDLIRGGSQG